MRYSLAVILCFCCLTLSAQAKTLRYEFDVVASDIGFSSLATSSGAAPTATQTEALVADHHALAHLVGLTGRVILDIVRGTSHIAPPTFETYDVYCVSGLLCGSGNPFNAPTRMSLQSNPGTAPSHHAELLTNYFFHTGYSWDFNLDFSAEGVFDGSLTFTDDALPFGFDTHNGTLFNWSNPVANFSLANGSSRLISNPLPPTAILLGAALVPLVWRRRKNRA